VSVRSLDRLKVYILYTSLFVYCKLLTFCPLLLCFVVCFMFFRIYFKLRLMHEMRAIVIDDSWCLEH